MTGGLPAYLMYGLRVASEISLGVEPLADEIAEVTITWGPPAFVPSDVPAGQVIAQQVVGGRPSYTVTAVEGGFLLRFHRACDVLISADLGQVECRPDPELDRELVAVFIVGTVAAFLLAAAGRLVLHGSVIALGSAALAFVGRSGSGKSTLAALCCAAGASLVSDDVLGIDCDGVPRCVGGWPELRLRPAAAGIVDLFPTETVTRTTSDGRLALQVTSTATDSRPLSALILARPCRAPLELALSSLTAKQAVLHILASGRIEGWLEPADLRRQFELASTLANNVPVLVADVPWGPPFSLDVARTLLARITDLAERSGES
jgi:hypothetical protein